MGIIDSEVWKNLYDAEQRFNDQLRLMARDIVANRLDRDNLTEDNKGRLERRAMYKVDGICSALRDEIFPIFESLETEDPPDVPE
jgi:hypothetical protein